MTVEEVTERHNALVAHMRKEAANNKIDLAEMQDDIDLLLIRLASLEAQVNNL